ncbi:hypothetical protein C7447_101202 [Tenacibaculum adriaticum]|uniref:Uncharacterized protein n=1 Tax=Tenacibaculum adriaticum TaxID=413713 RepID=A0A5S5DXS2_9FLAO|nr:hypothetical protein [Tenacibaculum adriaticum]TYP99602.1 hypothetical protein C7447_101202 [Tenacibaculum adriaticum]
MRDILLLDKRKGVNGLKNGVDEYLLIKVYKIKILFEITNSNYFK